MAFHYVVGKIMTIEGAPLWDTPSPCFDFVLDQWECFVLNNKNNNILKILKFSFQRGPNIIRIVYYHYPNCVLTLSELCIIVYYQLQNKIVYCRNQGAY